MDASAVIGTQTLGRDTGTSALAPDRAPGDLGARDSTSPPSEGGTTTSPPPAQGRAARRGGRRGRTLAVAAAVVALAALAWLALLAGWWVGVAPAGAVIGLLVVRHPGLVGATAGAAVWGGELARQSLSHDVGRIGEITAGLAFLPGGAATVIAVTVVVGALLGGVAAWWVASLRRLLRP